MDLGYVQVSGGAGERWANGRGSSIPLLSKTVRLPVVPGQDQDKTYGVAWGVCREPGAGFGYLLELTGKREGRILAWLNAGGSAYACSEPLSYLPKGVPDILLTKWADDERAGKVEARLGQGDDLDVVSGYRSTRTGSFSFENPAVDMGACGSSALDLRRFLAVSFLAFVHIPRERGERIEPCATIPDVLARMLSLPLPDAVDLLLTRVEEAPPTAWRDATVGPGARSGSRAQGDEQVSGFERYAAHVLAEAGASDLRAVAARRMVSVGRLSGAGMFWMGIDAEDLASEDGRALLSIEAALNRLALIAPAFRDAGGLLRSAHVLAACSREDEAVLRGFPARLSGLVRAHEQENPLRSIAGATAPRGGDWDVRTRFAAACEAMALPCRLRYRFDVDVRTGAVAIGFVMPPERSFPATRWDESAGAWVRGFDRAAAATAYGLRLAAVLAMAAFGCGVGIMRATVTALAGTTEHDALFSLAFDRVAFMERALPRIEAGDLSRLALDACARDLLEVISPVACSADVAPDGSFGLAGPALPSGVELDRTPIARDRRVLPAPLADALRAVRVCDLDVLDAADDALIARVREAYQLAESSPVRAVEMLEDIVSAYDACDMGDASRLYCSDPVARLLIDLIPADRSARYVKMPDSEFAARSFLSRLYRLMHEPGLALAYAQECVEFAPTTSNGYTDAASALIDLDRYDEAYELLVQALRVTVIPVVASYIYYRLAYVCWLKGRRALALACYVLVGEDAPVSDRASLEMIELMREMGVSEKPSRSAARSALADAGVPLVPTDDLVALAARLAVQLADAGMPRVAAPLTGVLAMSAGGDVLEVVGMSLAKGASF